MSLRPAQRPWLLAGIAVACLLGCLYWARSAAAGILLAYLAAYVFFLGVALGSMALLMIHALTGGPWGELLRAPLRAGMSLLPLLAVLLLPLLVGAHALYPWFADDGTTLPAQRWYLDAPFFFVRAVVCFAIWLLLMHGLRKRLDAAVDLQRFAAIGLILYVLSVSVAAVDWIMSLVPAWHSSVLGLIVVISQLVAAAALAIRGVTIRDDGTASQQRDLGNLLLMLVLAWAYLAFMDYLTAWIADLPADTAWYLPRLDSSWRWLGVALCVVGLGLPFAVLLSRRAKAQQWWLRGVASIVLLAQALFACWLVLPSLRPHGFQLGLQDALAWCGIGALCWCWFEQRRSKHVDGVGR